MPPDENVPFWGTQLRRLDRQPTGKDFFTGWMEAISGEGSVMTVFAYDLTHKHQTKANDCWYASIQMVKTWAAGGIKTKATGQHTSYLHGGLLGHKLHADAARSKHFSHVLVENGMQTIPKSELSLALLEAPAAYAAAPNVLSCLKKYGPFVIGGSYGAFGPFKDLGHFIVMAGIDTERQMYKIYDPDKRGPEWRPRQAVAGPWWDDDESAFGLAPTE